jgi:hypothetical protein
MNNDNKEKSVVLSLEYLNKLYQNLLTEYQQAVADYISYLQQNDNQQLLYFINLSVNMTKCHVFNFGILLSKYDTKIKHLK